VGCSKRLAGGSSKAGSDSGAGNLWTVHAKAAVTKKRLSTKMTVKKPVHPNANLSEGERLRLNLRLRDTCERIAIPEFYCKRN
jgi:hypothetical protein